MCHPLEQPEFSDHADRQERSGSCYNQVTMVAARPIRRRRFQFGLTTMFVLVTVFAAILAYHVNWVRQRHEALLRASHLAGPIRAPGLLWLFGEQGYREIDVVFDPDDTTQEAATNESNRAADLFPEAESVSAYGVRNIC